jgi:hypothetical protein
VVNRPKFKNQTSGERKPSGNRSAKSGSLLVELMVAMAILVSISIPLLSAFAQAQKSMRARYQRAVAMELIDGEMEILTAGEWREFKEGSQPYPLQGGSARNLPPGGATLTITNGRVRLEWAPAKRDAGGKITREAAVK